MAKKHVFKVGDRVRVKQPVEASYSRYANNPRITLTPDIVGTIGAADVPAVRNIYGPYYFCVDFLACETGTMQRASVYPDNILLAD